jgi:hypothetical protein
VVELSILPNVVIYSFRNVLFEVFTCFFVLFYGNIFFIYSIECKASKGGGSIFCLGPVNAVLEDVYFIDCNAGYGGALWFFSQVVNGSLLLLGYLWI